MFVPTRRTPPPQTVSLSLGGLAARILKRELHTGGLIIGTLFLALSLTPTLLPREDTVQGIISGLSLTAGYGTGVALNALWRYLELPRLTERAKWVLHVLTAAACLLLAIAFLWQATEWQNTVRSLMDMEETARVQPLWVGFVAAAVFLTGLIAARVFRIVAVYLQRRLQRYIPPRLSHFGGLLIALALFWGMIDGVLFAFLLRATDATHQQIDAAMEPEIERPSDPQRTGSAESLVRWEEVGRTGRRFLHAGPRAEHIQRYLDEDGTARTPLRVYVGLNAADTAEERAALALEELQRVDAFDRSVLLLITPTGTGWVDPAAMEPVEYMHRGDIASVAAQYSYLPSPFALMLEGEYGVEQARALFEAVYGYWTELPEDERPRLYLHGLSLGALNSDRSFDVYDIIEDPFQGALWSGPPFRSETWRTVTERRDPGSPAWQPRFRDGAVVRFMNQDGGLHDFDTDWGTYRIAFLQYASDPVTFFDPRSFYREPEWMQPPRGPDVSDDLRWFPAVTMLQLLADMGAGDSPPGYGHEYAASHYHEAWLALTEPEGWSPQQLEALEARWAGREPAADRPQ